MPRSIHPKQVQTTGIGSEVVCKDIIVIGAGIVGVCCALELQAAGYSVNLIDAKGIGEECSFGNAGHIAVEHIHPLATPALFRQLPAMLFQKNSPLSLKWQYLPALAPWLIRFLYAARPGQVTRGIKAISALNRGALQAYRDLNQRFGLEGLLKEEGTLVAFSNEASFKTMRAERPLLEDHGIKADPLGQQALHDFDPSLNPGLIGAMHFPGSAHVSDPHSLVKTLAGHFTALGGCITIDKITDIRQIGLQSLVMSDVRKYTCKKLVVAAGAWSHKLAKKLGYSFPLETERGYHLMINDPNVAPRIPTTSAEGKFVATPMEQGLRIAGRVELGGLKLPMDQAKADNLMPLAKALMPKLTEEETSQWMGFRPTLPDSLPVIGTAPKHKSVYFAFGHNHLGLTQAAITGRLIRQCIMGQTTDIDLTAYAAGRF
jgi:glycine/D-amino acid oxidase-like deaminating enzyme